MHIRIFPFLLFLMTLVGMNQGEIERNRILLEADRTSEGIVLKVKTTQHTKLMVYDFVEASFVPDLWQEHLIPYRYLAKGGYEFSLVGNDERHDYVLSPLPSLKSIGTTTNNLLLEKDGGLVIEEEFNLNVSRRYSVDDGGMVFHMEYKIDDMASMLDIEPYLVLGTTEEKVSGGVLDMEEGGVVLDLESTNSKDFFLCVGYEFVGILSSMPARVVSKKGYPKIDASFTFRPYRLYGNDGMVVLHES